MHPYGDLAGSATVATWGSQAADAVHTGVRGAKPRLDVTVRRQPAGGQRVGGLVAEDDFFVTVRDARIRAVVRRTAGTTGVKTYLRETTAARRVTTRNPTRGDWRNRNETAC